MIRRQIRGIRDSIPGGYVLGRGTSVGKGAPTLIPVTFDADGAISGGGGGSTVKNMAVEFFCSSTPIQSEIFGQAIIPKDFTLAAGLSGSYAKATVAATGTFSMNMLKNGSIIGSMTWTAGQTSASFTFAADVAFSAGDLLRVDVPATVDATLANITILLYGTL